ncbi:MULTISPECIES: Hpt domain-containing protein [Phyllobacteriaceae]|uniref:Histidine kinase n=1 Tax=Mesorhizobium hungaricum TaxID=1566387 RepID=A0A1C2DSE0_9HYPH|nr:MULTISPECIES: Hpt domain-containing protein [Mesorhizobium]MBN9235956.1 Hpt domain-containing protein [Mesorhizobium sp.]OCX17669.1 histidine kinase [Mesorhizobium hungaricum]
MRSVNSVAFSMPGGDASGPARSRPVDLEHLSRQTMDDRDLEREVLALFVQQALSVRDELPAADKSRRLLLAHGLKGSARGVGAFTIADWASEFERRPEDERLAGRLAKLIEDVRDFIAAVNR